MTPKIYIMIAIATGLAIAAFNKPKVYKELYWLLVKTIFSTLPIVLIWYVGYRWAQSDFMPLVDPDKIKQAEAFNDTGMYCVSYIIIVFLCWAYLDFLKWLASKVIEHSDNKVPEE